MPPLQQGALGRSTASEMSPLLQPEHIDLQNVLILEPGWANPICFLKGTIRPPLKFMLIRLALVTLHTLVLP